MDEQKYPSINEVLEETRRTLDFQFEQLDGLDTKSGIVLGVDGVIITLLITALLEKPDLFNSLWLKILIAIVLVIFFISLFISFRNIRIIKWSKPPEIINLRTGYLMEDAQTTKLKIIDTMIEKGIKKNDILLDKGFRLYKWSYRMLFTGLVVIAIGVIALLIFR